MHKTVTTTLPYIFSQDSLPASLPPSDFHLLASYDDDHDCCPVTKVPFFLPIHVFASFIASSVYSIGLEFVDSTLRPRRQLHSNSPQSQVKARRYAYPNRFYRS